MTTYRTEYMVTLSADTVSRLGCPQYAVRVSDIPACELCIALNARGVPCVFRAEELVVCSEQSEAEIDHLIRNIIEEMDSKFMPSELVMTGPEPEPGAINHPGSESRPVPPPTNDRFNNNPEPVMVAQNHNNTNTKPARKPTAAPKKPAAATATARTGTDTSTATNAKTAGAVGAAAETTKAAARGTRIATEINLTAKIACGSAVTASNPRLLGRTAEAKITETRFAVKSIAGSVRISMELLPEGGRVSHPDVIYSVLYCRWITNGHMPVLDGLLCRSNGLSTFGGHLPAGFYLFFRFRIARHASDSAHFRIEFDARCVKMVDRNESGTNREVAMLLPLLCACKVSLEGTLEDMVSAPGLPSRRRSPTYAVREIVPSHVTGDYSDMRHEAVHRVGMACRDGGLDTSLEISPHPRKQAYAAVLQRVFKRRMSVSGVSCPQSNSIKYCKIALEAPGWRTLTLTGMPLDDAFEQGKGGLELIVPAESLIDNFSTARSVLRLCIQDIHAHFLALLAAATTSGMVGTTVSMVPQVALFSKLSSVIQPMEPKHAASVTTLTTKASPPVDDTFRITFMKASALVAEKRCSSPQSHPADTADSAPSEPAHPTQVVPKMLGQHSRPSTMVEALSVVQGAHAMYASRFSQAGVPGWLQEELVDCCKLNGKSGISVQEMDKRIQASMSEAAVYRGIASVVNVDWSLLAEKKGMAIPEARMSEEAAHMRGAGDSRAGGDSPVTPNKKAPQTLQVKQQSGVKRSNPKAIDDVAPKAAKKARVTFADNGAKSTQESASQVPAANPVESCERSEEALKKFDVNTLKEFLKAKGQKIGGNKTELIARVMQLK